MRLSGISKLLVASLACLDFCLGPLFSNWVPKQFPKVGRKWPKSGLKRGSKNAEKTYHFLCTKMGFSMKRIALTERASGHRLSKSVHCQQVS